MWKMAHFEVAHFIHILTQADLKKWPFLQEIQIEEIDSDVDLLIGLNIPKALEPWRIVNSQGDDPYAVRTLSAFT